MAEVFYHWVFPSDQIEAEKERILESMISVVKANGILIPKEEMLIREVAQAEGKDGDVTVAIIKQELEASEEDSETALTSQSRPRKRMDSNFF